WKGRDYVVLENPAGEPLSRIRRATLKIEDVVDIVHGVCRALDAAHQHGILHGLLNPECVLLDASAEDCVVKVRNFGAGLLLDLTTVRSAEEVRRVFTYLAPEQSGILRRPADARSDIYSLGIVFYELLAGVPPYEAKDVNELISEHISRQPAPPSRSNPEVPEILERMVLKLIAKDPEDRYQTLGGLIADLEEYESRKRSGAERIQFEIAQNDRQRKLSFQTRLIGREAELAKLQLAAEHACRGEGGVCFIHGEPGIGKTRLINELRADVHRLGGVFIGGKCYQYESGTPFKALSEAIEAYVERVRRISPADRDRRVREMKQSIGDLGGEVLKLTPKIRELIGEPPSLAQLEPDKQRARFLVTAVSFLAELGTPELPVVIFLEDLQWSDEGTVELLDRLAPKLDERAVLLIISYRSNEVGPEHPLIRLKTRLEQAGVAFDEIGVRAFDSAETEVMVSRILGERPEAVRLVAEFLHARTRGNPFFNLELLRTLVEEKVVQYQDGHYRCAASELERAQLPENIVEAVLRRIKDVPPEDIGVLSYAAVIGKQVDLGLLGRLSGRTPEELLVSVENGIQHQILSRDPMSDGSVQFVHDRVREAFYRRVDENEVVRLHRRIAEALEAEHPKAEGVVAYDLAYHYSKSRVDEKAFIYSRKAAELAILASAHALAIQLFDQARETLERLGRGQGPDMIQVLENLGELYRLSGSFEEALKSLRQCEAMIPQGDMQGRAQVLAKMADAFFERGEAAKAAILIERALRRIGASLPRTRFGLNLAITREFLKQLYHIVRPEWMCRRFPEATVLDSIKVRLISRLVYIHYFNDMDRSFHAFLSNLNLCENRAISK
ncbi:MAG: AAA family ATPase, partial [Verrucomicrobiae bacterium]|nr:AAA family ATPase [Verrucomicrobiae bacterium]